MAATRGHMFYIGLYRENLKKSSCLKPESLDIWYLASPSGPLPSLPGQKWPHPGGHMIYIGLYRENVKKSSCLKPQVKEP